MRICRYLHPQYGVELGFILEESVYCLSPLASDPTTLQEWLRLSDPASMLSEAVAKALDRGLADRVGSFEALLSPESPDAPSLLPPIDHQEVWAAGVTYIRSKQAREQESEGGGSFYGKVYNADRPELFFKATPHRTVGPNQPIRIRKDSSWNVPEPELALVISSSMQLVGFTIGNDVSSRDIEGENPLYLPQAKVYLGSCALGPAILIAGPDAPTTFDISLFIERDGKAVYEGSTSTVQMKRSLTELISYLGRENSFPDGVILLTGTGIVPPDDFTLEVGDIVSITISGIGTLRNPVE